MASIAEVPVFDIPAFVWEHSHHGSQSTPMPQKPSADTKQRQILKQVQVSKAKASFEEQAAELRKSTEGRKHTPAEALQREGRKSR